MDPDDKRLAVKVENHPLEYVHFEAVIPDGNYGAGPMIAWDRGLFRPLVDPAQGMLDGEIKFELYGYKLRGAFTLVHTGKGKRGRSSGRGSNDWLLIKKRDEPTEAYLASGAAAVDGERAVGADDRRARGRRAAPARGRRASSPSSARRSARSRRARRADAVPDRRRAVLVGRLGVRAQVRRLPHARVRRRRPGDAALSLGRRIRPMRYPELTSALRALPMPGLVLDGEIVMLDAEGKPGLSQARRCARQMHRDVGDPARRAGRRR